MGRRAVELSHITIIQDTECQGQNAHTVRKGVFYTDMKCNLKFIELFHLLVSHVSLLFPLRWLYNILTNFSKLDIGNRKFNYIFRQNTESDFYLLTKNSGHIPRQNKKKSKVTNPQNSLFAINNKGFWSKKTINWRNIQNKPASLYHPQCYI